MENLGSDPYEKVDDTDEEAIEAAKEVLQNLTKTAKTLKIYLPNNPIHQKFINLLHEKMQAFHEGFGALRLRVKRFEIHCSGEIVYENTDRLESIAFKLYIDGLREISFLPGIDKEELIDFLNVLGKESSEEGEDDDMVTLLWERHFSHIQYIVVDELEGDVSEISDCKELKPKPPSAEQLRAVYTQEAEVAPGALAPKGIEIPSLHIFKLTDEEINSIKRELRWEREIDIVEELEGMLFDILRIEQDPVIFSDVLDVLDDILQKLMYRGDFGYAKKILVFYGEMIDPAKALKTEFVDLVQKAITRAGEPQRILDLAPVINHISTEQTEDFVSFMVLLDESVISPLVELLGVVNTMKPRRAICDVLTAIGRRNFDAIAVKLDDERWYLVRNLIYIIGKIGNERAIEYLPRFIQHEEIKVRKEVLHVLDSMDHPGAHQLFLDFLPDPDLSNRVYAIKSLAKKGIKEGLSVLLEMIGSKDFDQKALYEKKEIYAAVAQLGGDAVVPEMHKYVKKRWSLFRSLHFEERGLCAVVALQRIGSPQAIQALLDGSDSGNKKIREACQKALNQLGP
ncbi:MAG: HEAT repeat domain-containing protein [Nitrospiria bacterium]